MSALQAIPCGHLIEVEPALCSLGRRMPQDCGQCAAYRHA